MAKARRIKGIDCHAAATIGIRLVLIGRFEEMRKLRSDALNWEDPEGVHSMRVASRRLRSAMRDFMPYLRKRALLSSAKQIRDIADALGNVRDQDVGILALEKLRADTPADVSNVLDELIEVRRQERDEARQRVKKTITSARLKQLSSTFGEAINSATDDRRRKPAAESSLKYIDVARAVILDRLEEVEKLSNSLYHPLDVEPLHDMRIAAKRLRYAIELFQECWGKDVLPFAQAVADLQLSLGELHDCDVWIDSFGKHAIASKRKNQPDQSDAFAWLLSYFMKVRNDCLINAFAGWRRWEIENLSTKLRDILTAKQLTSEPADQPTSEGPSAESAKVATESPAG